MSPDSASAWLSQRDSGCSHATFRISTKNARNRLELVPLHRIKKYIKYDCVQE